MTVFEATAWRERAIVCVGLAALTALCWLYLWQGAGMGMPALMMTDAALFPHRLPEPMPGMRMPPIGWFTVVIMWWVMMIAMMLPSAVPMVLLYLRVIRHAGMQSAALRGGVLFVGGYLLVWLLFSILATIAQYLLRHLGLIEPMMLWSQSALLSAGVLIATGIYQLTPLKQVCLKQCRGTAHFLTAHWRKGRFGPLLMGMQHGAWCVGCCWMLMAILFVGGVMNLIWIALLALLVLIEKLTVNGVMVGRGVGVTLLLWGIATLIV